MDALSKKFYAGLYTEIVNDFVESPNPLPMGETEAVYVIGSLCFLSRVPEAEALLENFQKSMKVETLLESKFYLVMALRRQRRKSSSAQSRRLIFDILRIARRHKNLGDRTVFMVFCAISFYRFFDARYSLSLHWARKAYDRAFRSQFPYGRILAYDLMGHSQLRIGDVRAGIKNLKNSASLAETLGRGATKQATDVTLRLFRSSYGLDHGRVLYEEINGAIRACTFENSFTMAVLILELARIQVLIGEGHQVDASLREAGEWIYKLDLPFFDTELSFRYACLATAKESYEKALNLLRSARVRMSDYSDAVMELKVLGLEEQILQATGKSKEAEELRPRIVTLARRSGALINQRINNRKNISKMEPFRRGEDILGDLFEDVATDTLESRVQILNSGFNGLIPKMVGVSQFSQAILFGFLRESVTIISDGHVRHDPDGWPDLVRKLFFTLGEKRSQSKEEIAQNVWRQKYNPLRHDPLIYALIARARKMLEPYDTWLGVHDGTYSLGGSVRVLDVTLASPATNQQETILKNVNYNRHPDLSVRQSRIMDLCERLGAVTNKDVCEAFQVSEVTAGRDLAEMVEKGLLQRVGKGRATSYTRP
ncbi:MAG: DeoR family transcriptional regulator [Proteobacteria bacterium]|nr:DeoR family transcriptional regulator [Pseudomonadota bacterium]